MQVWVEIFERQIIAVIDALERLHHGGPIGCAVEQRAEGLERVVGPFLREFLEMRVLDPIAELRDPVLGKLKHHDVAGVEMNADVTAVKTIDKRVDLSG